MIKVYFKLNLGLFCLAKRIALATKALEVLNAGEVKDHEEAQKREYSRALLQKVLIWVLNTSRFHVPCFSALLKILTKGHLL